MPNIEHKQAIVAEIQEKLQQSTLVVFTDYRGLNVEEINDLRNRLRQPGLEIKVLKNTMMGFALDNLGLGAMRTDIIGPNAVMFSAGDPVEPSRILNEFAKTHKKFEVKVGILEGKPISADNVRDLAELPSREVLVATVLGTMQAPITSFVRVLNANITGLAQVLDQIREQKEAS